MRAALLTVFTLEIIISTMKASTIFKHTSHTSHWTVYICCIFYANPCQTYQDISLWIINHIQIEELEDTSGDKQWLFTQGKINGCMKFDSIPQRGCFSLTYRSTATQQHNGCTLCLAVCSNRHNIKLFFKLSPVHLELNIYLNLLGTLVHYQKKCVLPKSKSYITYIDVFSITGNQPNILFFWKWKKKKKSINKYKWLCL